MVGVVFEMIVPVYFPPLPPELCRCCCEVSETIFIIVVVVVCKKILLFYCSPYLFYVKMAQWSIVVRLAIVISLRI